MQEEDQAELGSGNQPEEAMSAEGSPAQPATADESRIAALWRRSLRWVAGIGFVFALGVLVLFFIRVRPQSDQIRSLQRQLDETQQELTSAQARVDELEPLQDQNQQLEEQLARSQQHLELLAVLVDVANAQLEIAQDQPGAARAALDETDARLETLLEALEGQNAEAVRGMRNRLGLVLEGLEDDIFAAQRDLEIMANNLVELEQQMFQD